MTSSRRKTPIFGNTTADSDKPFKVSEHKRERRGVAQGRDLGSKAFGNRWSAPKDGRHWWAKATAKDVRK